MSASALCTGSTEIPSRQNAFLMRFSRICNWVFHAKSHQALVWRIVWSNPKKICFVRSSCHKFRLVVTGLNVQFSFKQIYHCHGIYLNNLRCVHVSQTISLSISLLELPPPIRPYINNKNYFIWCARPSYVWPVFGKLSPYLRFVPYTTSVKMFSLLLKKMWISVCWCENLKFCLFWCQKIWN